MDNEYKKIFILIPYQRNVKSIHMKMTNPNMKENEPFLNWVISYSVEQLELSQKEEKSFSKLISMAMRLSPQAQKG